MGWAGHVVHMGRSGMHAVFWWESSEGKRPLGSPRRRSEYNIKMDLREIGWGFMDSIIQAQARDQWRALVNMVMNLRVLYNIGKFLSI
jgi:hypothetical protein